MIDSESPDHSSKFRSQGHDRSDKSGPATIRREHHLTFDGLLLLLDVLGDFFQGCCGDKEGKERQAKDRTDGRTDGRTEGILDDSIRFMRHLHPLPIAFRTHGHQCHTTCTIQHNTTQHTTSITAATEIDTTSAEQERLFTRSAFAHCCCYCYNHNNK